MYAEAMSRTLDGDLGTHRTMTIFKSDPVALHADIELGVEPGAGRRRGFDVVAAWKLRRELQRLHPAIVVAHGGESLKYAAPVAPRESRLVYYKIGTSRVHLSHWLRRVVYRLLVWRCDVVAGVSREMVVEARDILGVSAEKGVYVPNGRDPEPFVMWKGSPDSKVRVVFVGHMTRTKRPEVFVEVIRHLVAMGDDVQGVLVGDGPMLEDVRARARDLPIDVLGRRDDVPEILSVGDVFLFTSLEEGEGMPGVLIEASLAGLPVVATEVPGARTVIDDGVTGFVVDVDDVQGLVRSVHRLVLDPGLRRGMGEAGRARALSQFALDASVDEWRRLLSRLLERPVEPVVP